MTEERFQEILELRRDIRIIEDVRRLSLSCILEYHSKTLPKEMIERFEKEVHQHLQSLLEPLQKEFAEL